MRGSRGFLFLLSLVVSLYALAWFGEGVRSHYLGFDWLPSLGRLPFLGRGSGSVRSPLLPDSIHQLVEAVESLHEAMERGEESLQPAAEVGVAVPDGDGVPAEALSSSDAPSVRAETAPSAPAVRSASQRKVKSPPLECNEEGWAQLGRFFSYLRGTVGGGDQVRIMHYGDSQVEGDRISSYLRSRLQSAFGGRGVGLVSAVPPVYPPYGLSVEPVGSWGFYSMMPAHRRKAGFLYGPMGSLSRFERQLYSQTDSARYVGEIRVKRKLKSGHSMRFTQCKALLNTHGASCGVSLWSGDSLLARHQVDQVEGPQQVMLPIADSIDRFTLRFESKSLVDVLGVSYETPSGVQMDNLPLRGSSGTDFGAIGDSMFHAIHTLLHPRLLLLQFGVNMVPSRLGNYAFYKRRLKEEIARLRILLPDCAFVVIGVSDMAEKVEEGFSSYPNVRLVRNAQRAAALESGIAFWDCYEAMGGENAIVAWVNASPPLATSDYVHFTPRGARYVGELFYSALMEAYARHQAGGDAGEVRNGD